MGTIPSKENKQKEPCTAKVVWEQKAGDMVGWRGETAHGKEST